LLFTKGDGPLNKNWIQRYLVLQGQTLFYYQNANDNTPKVIIPLTNATVGPIVKMDVNNSL